MWTKMIITAIENYASESGLSPQTLSFKIFGDGARYKKMKAGASVNERTFQRAYEWFKGRDINIME